MSSPRLLVVSQHFPPDVSASSVLVDNIVRYYREEVQAIGGFSFNKINPAFSPPCQAYYLKPPDQYFIQRLYYKIMPRLRIVNKTLMKRMVRKIHPQVIMGNYPEIEFLVSAFEIARAMGIPFYAYFHDLWAENMTRPWDVRMAQAWEERIIKESSRVICCTEAQQGYYKKKYGRQCDVLPHPVPDIDLDSLTYYPVKGVEKRIAFVGSLSRPMNTDALITLSKALAALPPEYKLYWYPISEIPFDYLAAEGLDTSRIVMRVLSTTEMRKELREASVLVAPLSFKNCSAEEVRTVFSNKLLTYFIIGRPVLVYGPADCYHIQSALKSGWGLTVDRDDTDLLAESLRLLADDIRLQKKLVAGGFEEAERRRASRVADELQQWVIRDTVSRN